MANVSCFNLNLDDGVQNSSDIYIMPYNVAKSAHAATHITVSGFPFGDSTKLYSVPAWLNGYGGEDFCRIDLACGGYYIAAYGNGLQIHEDGGK